ncbi:hypothetical protein PG985_008510 [Apiospora marii]|uniref:Uncharacterized protein n=1 Tax=Apiospora marii TaxID=335849 RepID=A0ABR1SS75_9PEZI
MGPTKWTAEKNEKLLSAIGQTLIKTATNAQKDSIEDYLRAYGHETTWEAIRQGRLSRGENTESPLGSLAQTGDITLSTIDNY